jgi:polysaccharide deacetylase 2 family uncharacterized protein YibQ
VVATGAAVLLALPNGPRPAPERPSAVVSLPPPRLALPPARPEPAEEAALPAWQRFAAAAPKADGRPVIAIVIDDVGMNRKRAAEAIALSAPLTLAFLPYAEGLPQLAAAARAAGHEILVHLPMEPVDHAADPGPNALVAALDEAELMRRLDWNLARFGGYVGVNNHMGSRFTADGARMAAVLRVLKARGLLWLDSRTTADSVGVALASRLGLPVAARDLFLDNEREAGAVAQQLHQLEELARRRGHAVAIGHPHEGTLAALARWLPQARARGFVLVPVSAIIARGGNGSAKG